VFLVDDGVVRTPPADSGCLLGVTRALVLELCAELGLAAEERAVPLDALSRAEEAFLTSSTREVAPIARVDGRDLPRAPGTVSEQLAAAFGDFIEREVDP